MLKKLFNKIKAFFICLLSFCWITECCLLLGLDDSGSIHGAGLNGFLTFGLWVIFMFIMASGHPIVADIISTVILAVLSVRTLGVEGSGLESVLDGITGLVFLFVIGKIFWSFIDRPGDPPDDPPGVKRSIREENGDDTLYDEPVNKRGTPVRGGTCPYLMQLNSAYSKNHNPYRCDICGMEYSWDHYDRYCHAPDHYRKCPFYHEP